ncbi:Transmembrane and coiled-coil domain-containing protein 7 [Operophtera brumata]|uniref:Transmembrane and coiled-coil domain-containing protein 7 n=1 Tax=Operophtera brumata TaxID=104452 RepID=A0A0L7KYU7_OPEBR|nr:Transmembrane and coiled-coil domain-containing protein 7 [Operophtera brumata]
MAKIIDIFDSLEKITQKEGQSEFVVAVLSDLVKKDFKNKSYEEHTGTYQLLRTFLLKIFNAIDELAAEIITDNSILISVKNQKILRTCFQLIASVGISNCLIPGLGISLTKRCSTSTVLPKLTFKDEEKYELLVDCTNFLTRSYKVPVMKNIIVTLHLSDYLAALMQLSFAPLKKPGTYNHFVMTQEMYDKLKEDRKQFLIIYEHLVANCFQPTLMKELLVLQSVSEPSPPMFVKRVIAKEMSRRLLAPGGLLSLIRCFIESYDIDTGFEWKKVDMICRLVATKHGAITENDYLMNISSQLAQILSLNNAHYLATAVACVISLSEKYPESCSIKNLSKDIFQAFDYTSSKLNSHLPGTVILSPQEVNHKVNILHSCVFSAKLEWPITLLSPNLYVLFLIGSKCTKHEDLREKLKDILLKCIEKLSKLEVASLISKVLFENDKSNLSGIIIEEYDSGIAIKSGSSIGNKSENEELLYFLSLFNSSTEDSFVKAVFEASLDILINFSIKRKNKMNKDLLTLEDEPVLDDIDAQYATVLQLLSEISMSPKVLTALKNDPTIVINFIEHFLLKENSESNEECTSVALVLLNTVLANGNKNIDVEKKLVTIIPVLKRMSKDKSSFNHILCKEALSLMSSEAPAQSESACGKAISDVFDNLLPVRAHGIMELTKLIDAKDPEAISKKHFIFSVNGLAALCTHCTEDVLHMLCKEFLQLSSGHIKTERQNKAAETRVKIGEMAIVYKAELLNTMLCACRDDEPLIRTSALSNLAEIARDTLLQLKENLLPIYRTLKSLYRDESEDSVVRLHAQIALEELNDIVKQFLFPEVKMDFKISVLDKPEELFK